MPDLLLPTFATVLTIPVLALLATGLAGAFEARRRHREAGAADDASQATHHETRRGFHGDAHRNAHRTNQGLRGFLFLVSLAAGTTVSLLASESLALGGASLAGLGVLALLVAACGRRLTRHPHGNSVRAVSDAAAWWLGFGFLGGLTAQVLIQGGLLTAALLIALVAVAGAKALSRDGGLGVQVDDARLRESLDA